MLIEDEGRKQKVIIECVRFVFHFVFLNFSKKRRRKEGRNRSADEIENNGDI